jgi:Protein of unknown function (DUF3467)
MARRAPARRAKRERPSRLRYRWIDAGATTSYANSCSLESTAEVVFAHFGIDARLTRRIAITPAMAKRLAGLLAKVVSEYEERFGELRLDER